LKAIITGTNGTVAPVLANTLKNAGHTVVPWNRDRVPTENLAAVSAFITTERPDWFFHLATGSPDWAESIAQVCAHYQIRFLFTSSVSVFAATQRGPFTVNSVPQPEDSYGRYKLECEQRVCAAHPEALVVRLGWQIGETPGGNQMMDYLERTFRTEGQIAASTNWYQACSFLADTADSLKQIMETDGCGIFHLDGNPGLNFYTIVTALNRLAGNPWVVVPTETPHQNNLLPDQRLRVRPITDRFPGFSGK
jgi:dTDP-4-dehydrorhamnose reductase